MIFVTDSDGGLAEFDTSGVAVRSRSLAIEMLAETVRGAVAAGSLLESRPPGVRLFEASLELELEETVAACVHLVGRGLVMTEPEPPPADALF